MRILGIETSCDETSAAVIEGGTLRSNVVSSHLIHKRYGGVVPELASRAHQQLIVPVVEEALLRGGIAKEEIEGIAVTRGPGLAGALLIGISFAKALSLGLGIPLTGVNHLEGHIYSNFIDDPKPGFPLICLIVSGGHTQLVLVTGPLRHRLLGETLDDAAGEAYDKVAKMLGLGFPGGPVIDRFAAAGNREFVRFPRSYVDHAAYDFSFSGVKTAVLYWLRDNNLTPGNSTLPEKLCADLCASFQAAVVEVLVAKTMRAAAEFGVRHCAVAGGVSANSELRRQLKEAADARSISLYLPAPEYCTDNAAMIAKAGELRFEAGLRSSSDLSAEPNLSIP
jgi:N6-L-threonylcarbamoyladenine synthase